MCSTIVYSIIPPACHYSFLEACARVSNFKAILVQSSGLHFDCVQRFSIQRPHARYFKWFWITVRVGFKLTDLVCILFRWSLIEIQLMTFALNFSSFKMYNTKIIRIKFVENKSENWLNSNCISTLQKIQISHLLWRTHSSYDHRVAGWWKKWLVHILPIILYLGLVIQSRVND